MPHFPVFLMAVYRPPVFSPISALLPVRDREPTRLQLLVFVVLKPGSESDARKSSPVYCVDNFNKEHCAELFIKLCFIAANLDTEIGRACTSLETF